MIISDIRRFSFVVIVPPQQNLVVTLSTARHTLKKDKKKNTNKTWKQNVKNEINK